jgi:hypothetical protein
MKEEPEKCWVVFFLHILEEFFWKSCDLIKANAVVLPSSTTLLSATEILPLKLSTTPKYANLFTV